MKQIAKKFVDMKKLNINTITLIITFHDLEETMKFKGEP